MTHAERLARICATSEVTERLRLYQEYLKELLGRADEVGLRQLIDHLTNEAVSLVFSKAVLLSLAMALPALRFHRSLAYYAIDKMQPRLINFEEQLARVREDLSGLLAEEEEWEEAARVLAGIPLSSAHRPLRPQDKLRVYLRLAQLYLEVDEGGLAESCVNRAGPLLSECRDSPDFAEKELLFQALFARTLDFARRFLEAAHKYLQLSHVVQSEEQQIEAVSHAMTCAILGKAGRQRSRLIAMLYKDERCKVIAHWPLLRCMYLERLVSREEAANFAKTLRPHQLATLSDGVTTVLDRAVLEHNLVAASKLYTNIRFEELGRLLGVDSETAESISAKMIQEDQLSGIIDQIDGLLVFEDDAGEQQQQWDERIRATCLTINSALERIAARHPDFAIPDLV